MTILSRNNLRALTFFLALISLLIIWTTDRSAVVSYAYTLGIILFINLFCDNVKRPQNILYFHFYLLLALVVFLIQKNQIPSFMGLTGPEGIGTDDGTYYAGVTDGPIPPEIRTDIAEKMTFCDAIRFLYPFKINGPLCIVIFNLLGISFLPYLTYRVADTMFNDKAVSQKAELLTLFCPFLMSTGLIIMRDVVCTTLLTAAFLFFIMPLLLVPVALHFVFSVSKKKSNGAIILRVALVIIVLSISLIYIMPRLSSITGGRLEEGSFFRMSFIDFLLDYNEESVIAKIYNYPIYLRLPMLVVAFLIIPTLSFGFLSQGIFIPRLFLMSFLAPIYWWFFYRLFFCFILSYKQFTAQAKELFYTIIFLALTLGVVSLQVRHRVTMMPFFYIAIAYSGVYYKHNYKLLTSIMLFVFIVAQIVFVL